MNKLFRCLPLPFKLTLIAVIPLGFTFFLMLQLLEEKNENIRQLEGYRQQIETSQQVIDLTEELQTELRLSYIQILKGEQAKALSAQRAATDSIIGQLKTSDDPSIAGFSEYTFINDLARTRQRLDSSRIKPDALTSFYINAIYRLQTMSSSGTGGNAYLHSISKEIEGQKLLAQMVNFFGIMRLNIYNVLFTGQNGLGTLYGLRGVYDIYNSFERELLLHSPGAVASGYKKARQESSLKQTSDYLDHLFTTYSFDSSFTADSWWNTSQSAADELKKIRNTVRDQITTTLDRFYRQEREARTRFVLLFSICLALMVLVILYTIHILSKMLREIRSAAQKISLGLTGIQLKTFPKDVIGSLADSIIALDKNNRQLAETAHAIGRGDLSAALHPRSENDILGNALVQMQDGLRRFTEEQKQKQQHITKAVLYGQEKERSRIGEELHDNINQLLTSMNLYMNLMQDHKEKREELLPKTREILGIAIEEIRKLSKTLVLPSLRGQSLEESINDLITDLKVSSRVCFDVCLRNMQEDALTEEIKLNIYRIIQEQVKNILKYAEASRVFILLEKAGKRIKLVISDDGRGFDPKASRKGIGLSNIQSRAETFNGFVEVESKEGNGCTLKVYLDAGHAFPVKEETAQVKDA